MKSVIYRQPCCCTSVCSKASFSDCTIGPIPLYDDDDDDINDYGGDNDDDDGNDGDNQDDTDGDEDNDGDNTAGFCVTECIY